MDDLPGKVAVVTGASKGIGAACAIALGSRGCSVVVNYLSAEAGAHDTVKTIVRAGGKAIAVQGDVSQIVGISQIFTTAISNFGKLDILVNNAGIFGGTPLGQFCPAAFHNFFDTNVLGVLLCCREARTLFAEAGGTIVNIGSIVSRTGPAKSVLYNATKAALDSITLTLSKELACENIRVNSVNPGLVDTEGLRASGFMTYFRRLAEQSTANRLLTPADVAAAVTYYASPISSPRTGDIYELTTGDHVRVF
jgi:3-oxoacyl-[acyl-carrier protein] reductase